MHLLYLDDSGSVKNKSDEYIILAGVSAFERGPYYLSSSLDKIATEIWPDNPTGLEFHGTDIFGGRKHWRGIDKNERIIAYKKALLILGRSTKIRLFGAVIHKASVSPNDPVEYAFEQLCNRFDRFLRRIHLAKSDKQLGLIVLDKSSYETPLQGLAREFRDSGHRWGQLRYMADVPLFVDSRATRMIQYADLVAYALRKYYIKGEPQYYELISSRFDAEGGVIHGLVHYTPENSNCICAVCIQRSRPTRLTFESIKETIISETVIREMANEESKK